MRAQEVAGALEGRVLAANGEPIESAEVSAAGPALQGLRRTLTNSRGRLTLPALPAGAYDVTIRRLGFAPVRFQGVQVRLGATTSLGDIRLEAQAVEVREIVVPGARPIIDPVSPAAGATLDSSQFLSLPSDRSFRSLLTFVPQANASFYGDGVNVGGSTGLENAFFVDGMDVTVGNGTSIDLPFNFVREIQVTTGGYEAEFGRALSGVVNVVTPSGGNEFHGQLLGFYTGNQLRTAPRVGIYESDVTRFSRYDVGISVSGPLRRDRVWVAAAYNPTFVRKRESAGLIPDQLDFEARHLFAGKLSWKAAARTDVALTFLGDPSHRNGLEAVLPQTTDPAAALSRASGGSEAVALAVRHELDWHTALEVAFSRLWRRDDFAPRSGRTDLLAITRIDDWTTSVSSGGVVGFNRFRESRTAARITLTSWRGAHTIKVGAEYEANGFSGVVHGGLIIRESDSVYNWFDAFLQSRVWNHIPTLYGQDSWEATPRLTLSAGLRWEAQHLSGRAGPARTIPTELAPRLGLVLQTGEPGTARVFASAGRFYEQVPPISEIWWNGAGGYISRDFSQDPLVDSSNGTLLQRLNVPVPASPDLLGQYYDQFGIGFERMIGAGYKVGVRASYRTLRWVIEDGDPGDSVYRMGNPGRGALAAMPRARQRYGALEVSAARVAPGPVLVFASYVLSRNVGNYTGLYATEMALAQPNSGTQFDVPDGARNGYGPLPNDRTHVFKAAASYRVRPGLTLGGFLTVASGTPLSEGGTSAYGGSYWTFIRPRGSAGRTPTIWSLDLHASGKLPSPGRGRVHSQLQVDVFNVGSPRRPVLYDQRHYVSADTTDPASVNSYYRAVTSYQAPMSARVGVVVDF